MFSIIPYRTNNALAGRGLFDDFEDSFFRPFFDESFGGRLHTQNPMRVDVKEEDDRFVLQADLPGVKKENLKVEAHDGVLTLSANYSDESEAKGETGSYLIRERRSGSFSRSFSIDGIREEGITARFTDGVLTLELPKVTEAPRPEPRSIEIQ